MFSFKKNSRWSLAFVTLLNPNRFTLYSFTSFIVLYVQTMFFTTFFEYGGLGFKINNNYTVQIKDWHENNLLNDVKDALANLQYLNVFY